VAGKLLKICFKNMEDLFKSPEKGKKRQPEVLEIFMEIWKIIG
jgi:hypothetical protein